MLSHLDPISQAILEAVTRCGYAISVVGAADRHCFRAVSDDGEEFQVEAADPYAGACRLAAEVGIDLSADDAELAIEPDPVC